MAKRKKKGAWRKRLQQLKPANLFLRRGRVLWGRVLLALILIVGISIYATDLERQVKEQAAVNLAKKPFDQLTKDQFIARLRPEAESLETTYKVRASISIAQAALESDWGHSKLSTQYYNFFGVKAASGQPSVTMATKEFENGTWITVDGSFRRYSSWQESLEAHAKLLVNGTTDNPQRYAGVINGATYEDSANALYQGGYATDPDYSKKVIQIIKTYQLYKYDKS
jgi:flagellum-specific peptidoglycan hydrolase FlgJ